MDNLYLITRLDDIRAAFIALIVLAGIAFLVFMVVYFCYKGELAGKTEESIKDYHQDDVYWCNIGKKGNKMVSDNFLYFHGCTLCNSYYQARITALWCK